MLFDPKLKEQARADDAVDRLRIVHARLAEREESKEARRDLVLRSIALVAIAWIVALAYFQL